MMRTSWIASTALAVLAFVLVVVNMVFGQINLSSRNALTAREQYNVQSTQLARVDQLVVSTMVDAAQRDANDPLRSLLAGNGVTLHPPAPGQAVPAKP